MNVAVEFCERNKTELAALVTMIVSKGFQFVVPISAQIKRDNFKITLFFLENEKQERIKKVLELGSILANREYR